jgi:phosphoribosylformylglycinamidine (FGAM) synthase-like amidotransferase family enzyme
MTATYYTINAAGRKNYVVTEMLPATNKLKREWINNTVNQYEADGWCVKMEDNTIAFHRGLNEKSIVVVIG